MDRARLEQLKMMAVEHFRTIPPEQLKQNIEAAYEQSMELLAGGVTPIDFLIVGSNQTIVVEVKASDVRINRQEYQSLTEQWERDERTELTFVWPTYGLRGVQFA